MILTPGTSLWAVQQMLNGKKIGHKSWGPEEYIYIKEDVILSEDGDVQSLTQSMFDYTGWLIWTTPNPHTKGTFAWAWEEIQRGNKVKFKNVIYEKDTTDPHVVSKDLGEGRIRKTCWINLMHVNSTNWELAE